MSSLLTLIQQRRSCRSFLPQPVPDDMVQMILKAALWSPTSKNNRPWEFVVVQEKETLQKLSACKPHGASFLSGAPLSIVVLGNPQKSDVWVEDCSIATILMQMTAEDLGLGSTWIQVHKRMHNDQVSSSDYIKDIIKAPEHMDVAAILAIGFKEKERKPYSEKDLLWERVHKETYDR